jgi:hypothetical protein
VRPTRSVRARSSSIPTPAETITWNFPRLDADPTWGGGLGYRHHDVFFTYAERIGRSDCGAADAGIEWHPTRPPVVLDRWGPEAPGRRWTTVALLERPGPDKFVQGDRLRYEEMEFERIETLPALVPVEMEIAAGGTDRPRDEKEAEGWYEPRPRWEALGWLVLDARDVSQSAKPTGLRPELARRIQRRQDAYVATRSGCFSCRSVATSRPRGRRRAGHRILGISSPAARASSHSRRSTKPPRACAAWNPDIRGTRSRHGVLPRSTFPRIGCSVTCSQ